MPDVNEDQLRDNMGAFEAAVGSKHVELPALKLGRLLLALDGSNQDPAAEEMAAEIARRSGARMTLTYAYQGSTDDQREAYLRAQADQLVRQGVNVDVARSRAERPFRQILELCARDTCGLMVVCAPYLEDFHELGNASIGTNLDMLLNQRRVPVLVIREPGRPMPTCLSRIIMPLNMLPPDDATAAAWAFQLVGEGGMLHLVAIVDTEALEAARHVVGESVDVDRIDEGTLAGLGRPEMAGLVAAVQRRSAERSIGCRVTVRVGGVVAAIAEFANPEPCLIVTQGPVDSSTAGYERVQGMIRASRNPVLVV